METMTNFIFLGSKITAEGDYSHEIKRCLLGPWKKIYHKPRWHIKKQRHYIANKGPYNQSYGFSSSHVWMWELDRLEGWTRKNGYFGTVVLEKTLKNSSDCNEIKPVHPKGNQSWIFIGKTDAEAPILWPLEGKSGLLRKDPDAGKDWGKRRRGRQRWSFIFMIWSLTVHENNGT